MSLNFRSSLRGFNRQDVARYLEYLNNQHTAQLNQLNTDLENLRRKAEAQEESGRIQELEAKNAELEEKIQTLIKERDEALRRRDEDQRLAEVQLSGARMDSSQELEAYRRAVQFYFPGADIRAQMTVNLCASVEQDAPGQVDKPAAPVVLDLFDLLGGA